MMQAKDISTFDFMYAAYLTHREAGWAYTKGVHERLEAHYGQDIPYKVVLAKMAKLDHQHLMEGCECGCSSPMWLVDGKYEHNGLSRTIDWDDAAKVKELIERHRPAYVRTETA